MSDVKKKTPEVKHGTAFKTAEVALGVISAGSMVLNFIPGLNLVGAGVQGGVTVAQTGMDLATGDTKKAAKDFAVGTVFTGLSLIPELGAAAKGGELAIKAVGEGAATTEVVSVAGKTGGAATATLDAVKAGGKETGKTFLGRAADTVMKPVKAGWNGTKDLAGKTWEAAKKLPGMGTVVKGGNKAKNFVMTGSAQGVKAEETVTGGLTGAENYLRTGAVSGKGTSGFEGLKTSNRAMRKASQLYDKHTIGRKVVQTGLFAGATGVSMLSDDPPPPVNLTRAKTYDFSSGADNGQPLSTQWRDTVTAQRRHQLSQEAADHGATAATVAATSGANR